MNALPRGIWSGLIATAQMTQILFWGFRRMPPEDQTPLPPATLTREVGHKAGLPAPDQEESENHTLVAHFLFGAGCALGYSLLQSGREKQSHPLAEGASYGLFVWAGSYLAGIPAFGFRPSAYRMSPAQNALMLAAHLVWGLSLGAAEHELRERSGGMLDGRRSLKPSPERRAAS